MCMSCAKYVCLGGCATPTLAFIFLFFFFLNLYFGVRDSSIDLESNLCKLQHCK